MARDSAKGSHKLANIRRRDRRKSLYHNRLRERAAQPDEGLSVGQLIRKRRAERMLDWPRTRAGHNKQYMRRTAR